MPKPTCYNCIYSYWDKCQWLTSLSSGFPSRPVCANQPGSPGQLRPVPVGRVCRNFRPRPATPEGDIKSIPLGNSGLFVYVDAADYEWLSKYKWFFASGYAARRENGRTIFMHRQIMQAPRGMVVDHIDGNRANNSRVNLRVCTRRENLRNQGKRGGCRSVYKGVSRDQVHPKWFATIYYDDRSVPLGYHTEEIEAARAYDLRAVQVFGPYARVNLPDEWPPERRQQVHAAWLKSHPRPKPKRPKPQSKKAPSRPKPSAGKSPKPRPAERTRNKPPKPPKQKAKRPPRQRRRV